LVPDRFLIDRPFSFAYSAVTYPCHIDKYDIKLEYISIRIYRENYKKYIYMELNIRKRGEFTYFLFGKHEIE